MSVRAERGLPTGPQDLCVLLMGREVGSTLATSDNKQVYTAADTTSSASVYHATRIKSRQASEIDCKKPHLFSIHCSAVTFTSEQNRYPSTST